MKCNACPTRRWTLLKSLRGGSFKEQTCKSFPDNFQRIPTTCVCQWAHRPTCCKGARHKNKCFQLATRVALRTSVPVVFQFSWDLSSFLNQSPPCDPVFGSTFTFLKKFTAKALQLQAILSSGVCSKQLKELWVSIQAAATFHHFNKEIP